MKKGSLSEDELSQFVSTEHWYRHAINCRVFYTDGVKYVAERASAYWLLDEIAMIQLFDKRVAAEEFQVWNLKVALDMTAELQCEDGNRKVISSREIPRTDFPGSGITLWFSGNTILLPSEY